MSRDEFNWFNIRTSGEEVADEEWDVVEGTRRGAGRGGGGVGRVGGREVGRNRGGEDREQGWSRGKGGKQGAWA